MIDPSPNARISVFVIDDHDIVREGLVSLLSRQPDLVVAGQAASAEDALEGLATLQPNVVVVDHRLPGLDGVELCREIAERRLPSQVVMLSAILEQALVDAAFQAGARAYVIKDVEPTELLRAVRAAAEKRTLLDVKLAPTYTRVIQLPPDEPQITPLERRVLQRLVAGRSTAEIARDTGVSTNTVKWHLQSLYRKLDVRSRGEAAAAAMRRQLV